MTEWKHCPSCGHKLAPGISACPACGAALPSASTSTDPASTSPVPDAELDHLIEELRQSLAPSLQLLRLLGEGGMGLVFLARDPALKRNVVVKVLSPVLAQDSLARRRFEREAESAAAVSHPNVIGVHQVGELARSGTSYFVMQYVDGTTLVEEFPEGTRVQEPRARTIVGEVASALAAAHARGLVHRDIKPSNIMIERQTGRAIVLDFGISAVVRTESQLRSTKLTEEGTSIGTPQYMSPEQAAGESVTEQSDVYSLGLVAFELLAGRPPFVATSPMALMAAHLKDPPPKVRDVRPDVDPHLAELVDACLAKDPDERPTARIVADALLPQGGTAIEWPPPGLETLRGTGRKYLERFASFVGAEIVYILTLMFALVIVDERAAIPGILGLFLGMGVAVTAITASTRARRLPTQVRHARRAGFPNDVLLDVVIDPAADTERLINRRGPYARLDPDAVSRMMRQRRVHFGLQTVGLLVTMFAPLLAIIFGESDWLLLPLLLLPVAWYGPTWFTRVERRFRKRFVTFAPPDVRAALSPDVVTGWLGTAGREAPPASRSAPWLAQAAAGTLNGALFLILLVGIVGVLNWLAVMFTLDDYRPGDVKAHLEALQEARSLGIGGPPPRWAADSTGPRDASALDRLSILVTEETHQQVLEHTEPLDSVAWIDLFARVPDSLVAPLEAAAGYPHLDAWRSLASPSVPGKWYVDAVTDARGADSAPASYIICRCNRSVQDLWRFGELNRAAAVVALFRGRRSEAMQRLEENARVGLKLAADPVTLTPGVTTLLHAAASLTDVGRVVGDPELSATGRDLGAFAERLRQATEMFNGPTAAKAGSWVRSSQPDAFLDLVGDRELRPVHRWGLVRSVVEGVCYNGEELYFGFDGERDDFYDKALERVGDLPDAEEFGRFLREFEFEFEGRPRQPWLQWMWPFLWSIRHMVACERAGILQDSL
jgi:hypothetical protein